MKKKPKKCKHGRDPDLCCACRYGERSYLEYPERGGDSVDDMNKRINFKLKDGDYGENNRRD